MKPTVLVSTLASALIASALASQRLQLDDALSQAVVLAVTGCAAGLLVYFARCGRRKVKAKEIFRTKSYDEDTLRDLSHPSSFRLGQPRAPFLEVSNQELATFEAQVSKIYFVTDEEASGIDLEPPLKALRRQVQSIRNEEDKGGWRFHEPIDDLVLCRLLIATDFASTKAAQLVTKYVDFRASISGGVLPTSEWLHSGVAMVPFEDRFGRPMAVFRARYMNSKMTEGDMVRGYRATVDMMLHHMLYRRQPKEGEVARISETNPLEQYCLMLEVDGATWRNFSLMAVRIMISEGNNHYPDRLARIFILGCGASVQAMWKIVAPMLHPRTVKKVRLVAREDVPRFMKTLVEPRLLPPAYGGAAKAWPPPWEARFSEDLVGWVAAETWSRLGVIPAPRSSCNGIGTKGPEEQRGSTLGSCFGGCFGNR